MGIDLQLHVVGGGDAFGSGGRFNTCFVIDDSIGRFAIDFGATSMVALQAQTIEPASIDLIILTHLHGDHFGGLPFLLLYREYVASQTTPLTIAGPPGFAKRLAEITECMFPGNWKSDWRFTLNLIEIDVDAKSEICGRSIITKPVTHYAGPEPSTAVRIETSGKVLSFSGDTGWNDVLLDLAKGSDVFVCDCFDRFDQPYDGHLSYQTLLTKIEQIETKRIILNHLGPQMISDLENISIELANDGTTIKI